MKQFIDATKACHESSLFVSSSADAVLNTSDIADIFSQHAHGHGEELIIQRGIRPLDMEQILQLRSIHETDSGVRVVVVTEFRLGTTTIELEASETSDTGPQRV